MHPKRLGVIARTSAMRYKNTTKGIDRIGRELSVEYILEGSVLRIGERVRITAQLIQVSDQTHLWADTYDRTTQDVFAIQSDVARRVAGALAVTLLPEDQSTLDREPTASSVAHDAYLKGLYHWNKRTESSLQRAVQFFESAVETDPDFALAHVGLALAHVVLAGHGYLAPTVAFARVKEEAEKAIALDETLGEAHLARAIYRSYEWNHRGAEGAFREAIRLNPAHPTTHQWYAEFLTGQGRFEEALAQIKQAQHLDPASRIINAAVGMIYYRAHRFDEAVEQTLRSLDFDPNFPFAHFVLGRCYAEMGLFEEAVAEISQAIALGERSIEYVAALGYAYARAGRVDEAKRILDELHQCSRTQYVSAYSIAKVYAGLGEVDEAFRRLDRAYDERAVELGWILRGDPSIKSLHDDPRFDDLLRRIGLEP